MRQVLTLIVIFSATAVYGQTPVNMDKVAFYEQSETDSSLLKVVYPKENNTQGPAYFLNGQFMNQSLMTTLNPQMIDSMNIVKESIQIGEVNYYGLIYLKTKNGYTPKQISLTALKEKHTDLKNKPVIFMINSDIVKADYDNYMVDENYILQIIVDNVTMEKEGINLGIVKLLTKSEENIKKSKEIWIRGDKIAMDK